MKKVYIIFLTFCLLILWNYFLGAVNAEDYIEAKDVKYYFDNIESFDENLSRGIYQEVIIKGTLIEAEFKAQCKKSPCPPVKHFALQDIKNENYKIVIYQTNLLVQQLEIGKVYTLKGVLEKGVDLGRKVVDISDFKPKEIIEYPAAQ